MSSPTPGLAVHGQALIGKLVPRTSFLIRFARLSYLAICCIVPAVPGETLMCSPTPGLTVHGQALIGKLVPRTSFLIRFARLSYLAM